MILSTLVAATLAAAPAHSAAFWHQIAQNNYAVPTGGDVASLTDELIELLGSRDPELRDEIAYSTLAAWIYQTRVIEPAPLRRVVDRLLANLKDDIGERGTDRELPVEARGGPRVGPPGVRGRTVGSRQRARGTQRLVLKRHNVYPHAPLRSSGRNGTERADKR